MSSLANKRILLGVTGGIAAYKSAELVRLLIKQGATVRVVMTEAAQAFITPLTMQALSGNPVHTELVSLEAEAAMGHIELARWADLILVAPCSADFMSKLVSGEASDLLSTLFLASTAQKVLAPAMNQAMWASASTQANIETLKVRDYLLVGPAAGEQACGDVGLGRMVEPVDIVDACTNIFEPGLLANKRVVITAGPTREAIDPVRYISNHSSGKMGYALAEAAYEAGAKVTLISGPVALSSIDGVERISVESALDMYDAVQSHVQQADIFIGAAAVADYRVDQIADKKIKKEHGGMETIELIENPDIIASVAKLSSDTFVVGFAAETDRVIEHARSKLERKKLNMVIANNVADKTIGFNSDENAVTVVSADKEVDLEQKNKTVLARELIALIAETIH